MALPQVCRQSSCAEVTSRGPDIVVVRFLPGRGVELVDAEKIIEDVLFVAEGRVHGNLVDARELLFISTEARARFARQSPDALVGTALLVNSSIQSMLANLYLGVSKPKNPTKLFTSEEEALGWLRSRLAVAR